MARKDQPYLPLYVQDVLTDEKLIECSPAAHGVYFRLLCVLHKQAKYGLLCLKQKYKQKESKYENFACMLIKQMPFTEKQISDGLKELSEEGVIQISDEELSQKRMINDGELSIVRATIGKTGGSSVTKQYGKPGFLYWIGDSYNKNKIGISVNVLNRLYRLRSDLKLPKLEIKAKIPVSDMGLCEDLALDFFGESRDGEWIILPHGDMEMQFALLKANLLAKELANADIDIDIDNTNKTVFNTMPFAENFNGLPEIKIGSVIELFKITKQTDISSDQVSGLWNVFKIQHLTGKKYYANEDEVYSHFINWSKNQKIEKNGADKKSSGTTKFNAGANELLDRLKKQTTPK